MARQNPSNAGFGSQRLVVDGSSVRRDGASGGVLFWRSILVIAWLAVVVRSALALI